MELKEMIKVMQHFDNGGEVELISNRSDDNDWQVVFNPYWNWDNFTYRIKQQKQKVTIEKWLCQDRQNDYVVVETSNIEKYVLYKKIELIKSYEVEL